MENPSVTPARTTHYVLRGLLYCRPCDRTLVPAYSSDGQRFYGCPGVSCPRPWVPAGPTEEQVWARFAALNEDAARRIPAEGRQEALAAVLVRVVVGEQVGDLAYDWRD